MPAAVDRPAETTSAQKFAWPIDVAGATAFERAIGLPANVVDPIDVYVRRAEQLTAICMADGGFEVGRPLTESGRARLLDSIVYRSQTVGGGCDAWGTDRAFPGNHLRPIYDRLRGAALQRTEYQRVLKAYDNCFIAAGYSDFPDVEGQSEADATRVLADYNDAGDTCAQSSGLTDANRAVEFLVGDQLIANFSTDVEEYSELLEVDLGITEEVES